MFQRDLWPLFDGWGESLHVNPLKNALVHVVGDFLNPDSHNIPAGNSPCFKVWTLERTSLCVHTGSDWIFWFLWSPSDVHKESGVTLPPPSPLHQRYLSSSKRSAELTGGSSAAVLLQSCSPDPHRGTTVLPSGRTSPLQGSSHQRLKTRTAQAERDKQHADRENPLRWCCN